MLTKYSLGHKEARKIHARIINKPNSYSLMVTLDPKYNFMPLHEQHYNIDNELRCLFKRLNRTYNELMYTPELTKDYNIHYHVYFTMPEEMEYIVFEQNYKQMRRKMSYIGKYYCLTKIDDPEGEIKEYPFKDITRTKKVSKLDNLLFFPYHGYYKGQSPFKSDS